MANNVKKKKSITVINQYALEEEHRIRKAFKDKDWAEIKSSDSWMIFKVMSEFVEGFEKLAKIVPCVTIFGSARIKPSHPYYKMAEDIAEELVNNGYGVVTGGGPGIMEAGNRGAKRAGGKSVGLNIYLPHEQKGNIYIDADKLITFDYFFVRKVMFIKYSQGLLLCRVGLAHWMNSLKRSRSFKPKRLDGFLLCWWVKSFGAAWLTGSGKHLFLKKWSAKKTWNFSTLWILRKKL